MDTPDQRSELATTILDLGVFEYAAIGIAYLTPDCRIQRSNKFLQNLLSYTEQDLAKMNLEDLVHPQDRNRFAEAFKKLLSSNNSSEDLALRCFDAQGNSCNLRFLLSTFGETASTSPYVIALVENSLDTATAKLPGEEKESLDRKMFEIIAEKVPATVWLASPDLKTLHYVNPAYLEIWGLTKQQVIESSANEIFKRVHPEDIELVKAQIKHGPDESDSYTLNFRLLMDDGSIRYLEDRGTVLRDDNGKPLYVLGTHIDMTERVTYTTQLETLNQELQNAYDEVTRLNQYDTLTGCYNRKATLDHLSTAQYQFKRYEIPSSIVYMDLNRFKEVNDNFGHLAGDMVLKSFVNYMQGRIRQTDILGRLGGDEFLLLLPGTDQVNTELFLQKESMEFETRINDSQKLLMRYSAGLAELKFTMNSLDEWVDAADKAMYLDKPQ